MNTVQIMWKEIGIGLILLYLLRVVLDLYMLNKYKKLVALHGTISAEAFKIMRFLCRWPVEQADLCSV